MITTTSDIRDIVINLIASALFLAIAWLARRRWFVGLALVLIPLSVEIFNWPPYHLFSPVPRSVYSVIIAIVGGGILVWSLRWKLSGTLKATGNQGSSEIVAVYPNGVLELADIIEPGQTIDILGVSVQGFLHYRSSLVRALEQNSASIRLLVLRPTSRFVRDREKQEGVSIRRSQIGKEAEAAIGRVKEIESQVLEENAKRLSRGERRILGSVEIRTYDTLPYFGCIITDKLIRYSPYFIHDRGGYTPAFDFSSSGEIAGHIKRHFEKVWNEGQVEYKAVFD